MAVAAAPVAFNRKGEEASEDELDEEVDVNRYKGSQLESFEIKSFVGATVAVRDVDFAGPARRAERNTVLASILIGQ